MGLSQAEAESLNTALITAETAGALPSCLHYEVIGLCFWWDWLDGFSTTPMIKHYSPDVVVSVYPQLGHDPWTEINDTVDAVDDAAGNTAFSIFNDGWGLGDGEAETSVAHTNDISLNEVDVIGNPMITAMQEWGLLFLPSQAKPFVPYYQSALDGDQWRSGTLDLLNPASWLPGDKEVGNFPMYTWGSTYPRTGFDLNQNPAKAAAVIAVRGGNIASSPITGHLGFDLDSGGCRSAACVDAGAAFNDDSKTEWQMLLPHASSSCTANIEQGSNSPGYTSNISPNQQYAWVLWRLYQGCMQGDGKYIGSTKW